MMAYLTYMAERLEQMHRLLKPTGSIYLHCDPTASHYLKVVMDSIFGSKNFRNEIIWHYHMGNSGKKDYRRKHDTLFFYSRSEDYVGVQVRVPRRMKERRYNKVDADGRKCHVNGAGKIFYPDEGIMPDDVWSYLRDPKFTQLNSQAKERLGYPTQKPLSILQRIIEASSNEGDVVLDPFCGCGTTVEAAQLLKRQWVGVDISPIAIDLVKEKRLRNQNIPTKGIPADFDSARRLAKDEPFHFEAWAVTRLSGFAPNKVKVGDGGIDGRATLAMKPDKYPSKIALSQVKGGKFNLSYLRDFNSVADREKAAVSCFITLDKITSNSAHAEAARMNEIRIQGRPFDRMNLWSIEEYFDNRIPNLPIMRDPYTGKVENQKEIHFV